jgi:hypothetical protein
MDDRDRMEHRPYTPWIPWAITSVVLVLVAIAAYAIGVSQQAADGGEPFRRFWFGSGFWLFILFWMVFGSLRRWLWWGGGWGPWGPWGLRYRPWRYGPYYGHPYEDERAEWEEWHRREHERLGDRPRSGSAAPSSDAERRPIT